MKIFERAEKLGYKILFMDSKELDLLGTTHQEYKCELFLLQEWLREKHDIHLMIKCYINDDNITNEYAYDITYDKFTEDEFTEDDNYHLNWWDAYLEGIDESLLILEKK